jgi:hypothetical protein
VEVLLSKNGQESAEPFEDPFADEDETDDAGS